MFFAAAEALNLLKRMLVFNPKRRISVDECLAHPFFKGVRNPSIEASLHFIVSFICLYFIISFICLHFIISFICLAFCLFFHLFVQLFRDLQKFPRSLLPHEVVFVWLYFWLYLFIFWFLYFFHLVFFHSAFFISCSWKTCLFCRFLVFKSTINVLSFVKKELIILIQISFFFFFNFILLQVTATEKVRLPFNDWANMDEPQLRWVFELFGFAN